jgi:hypothetical protein
MALEYPSLAKMWADAQTITKGQMDLAEAQRKQQAASRLRDLFASAGGADLGSPTTLREIMKIDPETGLGYQKTLADLAKTQAETGYKQAQTAKAGMDAASTKQNFVIEGARRVRQYIDTLPPDQHQAALEQLYPQFVQSLGQTGAFDPAELQDMAAKGPDLKAFYSITGGGMDYDIQKAQRMEAEKLPYDLERKRAEAEIAANAPMSRADQARLDLQRQRLGLDEQQFGFQQQQAERKASMPKPLSAEAAGRFAMANQAIGDIQGARDLMFDPDGSLNYQNLFAANVPGTAGLGSAGRELRSRIENAVASKLRIETGAAATEGEIKNVAKRFMPTAMDTASSAADKLRRLEEFMQTTTSAMTGRPPGNGLVGDQGLQMDLAGRRGGGPTFGGQQQNKPIRARNKQGQTLELRNGQWVPVQ